MSGADAHILSQRGLVVTVEETLRDRCERTADEWIGVRRNRYERQTIRPAPQTRTKARPECIGLVLPLLDVRAKRTSRARRSAVDAGRTDGCDLEGNGHSGDSEPWTSVTEPDTCR